MAKARNTKNAIARLVLALDEGGKPDCDIHVPFTVVELNRAGFYKFPDGNFRSGNHVLIPAGGVRVLPVATPRPVLRTVSPAELESVRQFRKRFFELGLCS